MTNTFRFIPIALLAAALAASGCKTKQAATKASTSPNATTQAEPAAGGRPVDVGYDMRRFAFGSKITRGSVVMLIDKGDALLGPSLIQAGAKTVFHYSTSKGESPQQSGVVHLGTVGSMAELRPLDGELGMPSHVFVERALSDFSERGEVVKRLASFLGSGGFLCVVLPKPSADRGRQGMPAMEAPELMAAAQQAGLSLLQMNPTEASVDQFTFRKP